MISYILGFVGVIIFMIVSAVIAKALDKPERPILNGFDLYNKELERLADLRSERDISEKMYQERHEEICTRIDELVKKDGLLL